MDDLENPYQSPGSDEQGSKGIPFDSDDDVDPRTIGKARQVPTVAILLIIHGALMFVPGMCLIAMIVFIVPQMAQQVQMQRPANPNAPQLSEEAMRMMLYAIYGGISVVLFFLGGLNIFAGMRNYDYRNRVLGVISLVANIGSVFFSGVYLCQSHC